MSVILGTIGDVLSGIAIALVILSDVYICRAVWSKTHERHR